MEEITAKKLRCMTDMYIEECERNRKLEKTLATTKTELRQVKADYSRKIKSLKRITSSQNKLMSDRLEKVTASNDKLEKELRIADSQIRKIEASKSVLSDKNSEIISELDKAKQNNLIYRQKIESSSADIADRDATISNLQRELDKTVVASTAAKRDTSNRDEEIRRLKSELSSSDKAISDLESRVVACEEMLFEYQQAYADFYATALGTSVSGLSITASTSVAELKNLIQGATNTSNIAAMPNYDIGEADFIGSPVDVVEDLDEDNLATL
jgi:chromosome segregation ATPase